METAISISTKIVGTTASVVKFFVPRVLYDPRIVIRNSARIVKYFLPKKVVNLSVKCLTLITSFLSIVQQVQLLEQEVRDLRASSVENEEKYTRSRLINFSLSSRLLSLQQQIKEIENKYEERLQDEFNRSKELELRNKLELEDVAMRLQWHETQSEKHKEELAAQRKVIDKLENDRRLLMIKVQDLTEEIISTKMEANMSKDQERRTSEECEAKTQFIEKLLNNLDKLRFDEIVPHSSTPNASLDLEDLYNDLCLLKEKNFMLEDANEDLRASLLLAGIEHGQFLAGREHRVSFPDLEAMSKDEIQKALKEEQGFNAHLKTYIDNILLRILDNYPQLLEVQRGSQSLR